MSTESSGAQQGVEKGGIGFVHVDFPRNLFSISHHVPALISAETKRWVSRKTARRRRIMLFVTPRGRRLEVQVLNVGSQRYWGVKKGSSKSVTVGLTSIGHGLVSIDRSHWQAAVWCFQPEPV